MASWRKISKYDDPLQVLKRPMDKAFVEELKASRYGDFADYTLDAKVIGVRWGKIRNLRGEILDELFQRYKIALDLHLPGLKPEVFPVDRLDELEDRHSSQLGQRHCVQNDLRHTYKGLDLAYAFEGYGRFSHETESQSLRRQLLLGLIYYGWDPQRPIEELEAKGYLTAKGKSKNIPRESVYPLVEAITRGEWGEDLRKKYGLKGALSEAGRFAAIKKSADTIRKKAVARWPKDLLHDGFFYCSLQEIDWQAFNRAYDEKFFKVEYPEPLVISIPG